MANALFSDPGVALATFLHTLGAIGYLAGMAFYIGWARSIRRGHDNPSVLATGASLAYVSIIVNLVGGFLRTYAPGHPGLAQFGDSVWVTVMVAKHGALFAGIAAAAYLFEIHAPRLRRRGTAALPPRQARTANGMLTIVVASIVAAAVLGGASTVLDLGMAEPEPDGGTPLPGPVDAGGPYHFEGTVMQGAPESGTFEVRQGTARITAAFRADPPAGLPAYPYQFTISLLDPTGAATSGTTPSDATAPREVELTVASPAGGTWTYRVQAEAAVAAPYALDVMLEGGVVLEDSVELAAGQSLEINVRVAEGAVLNWDWSASMHLEWNIHTHSGSDPGVQGHDDAHAGSHAAQGAGIYSYFWRAEEATTLHYRVWGDFVVESVV